MLKSQALVCWCNWCRSGVGTGVGCKCYNPSKIKGLQASGVVGVGFLNSFLFYIYTPHISFLISFFSENIENLHFLHQCASNSVKSRLCAFQILHLFLHLTYTNYTKQLQLRRIQDTKKRQLPNQEAAPVHMLFNPSAPECSAGSSPPGTSFPGHGNAAVHWQSVLPPHSSRIRPDADRP